MAAYRDPDDMPVDPDADDEQALASAPSSRAIWRQADPDTDRPARLAEQDELEVDPVDPVIDRQEGVLSSRT